MVPLFDDDPDGTIVPELTIFAGVPSGVGSADGTGAAASFSHPQAWRWTGRATSSSPTRATTPSGRSQTSGCGDHRRGCCGAGERGQFPRPSSRLHSFPERRGDQSIDRQPLHYPPRCGHGCGSSQVATGALVLFESPRDPRSGLASLWSQVFGSTHVPIAQRFFALGGTYRPGCASPGSYQGAGRADQPMSLRRRVRGWQALPLPLVWNPICRLGFSGVAIRLRTA